MCPYNSKFAQELKETAFAPREMLALTSLAQKRWRFGVAIVATLFGVFIGLAGLAG